MVHSQTSRSRAGTTGMRWLATIIAIVVAYMLGGSGESADKIDKWLSSEGLTNIYVTYTEGQWSFTATAYEGCKVSGLQSYSSDGWILFGYDHGGNTWPKEGAVEAARADPAVCE